MNDNYSSEVADSFMDCDEASGIERLGASLGNGGISSHNSNLEPGYFNCQPMTSDYIGIKRKSFYSSPLPKKILRTIGNDKQQDDHVLINKANLQISHKVASDLLIDPYDILNQATSIKKSSVPVDSCIDSSVGAILADSVEVTSDFSSNASSVTQMVLGDLCDISSPVIFNENSSVPFNGSVDSSIGEISASTVNKTCETRTFYKHQDLDMMRCKTAHPLHRKEHIHRRLKCKFCCSIWCTRNDQRHIATYGVDVLSL